VRQERVPVSITVLLIYRSFKVKNFPMAEPVIIQVQLPHINQMLPIKHYE